MEFKPQNNWSRREPDTEVLMVLVPTGPFPLEFGGHPMAPMSGGRAPGLFLIPSLSDAESDLEHLVAKARRDSLAADGITIPLKEAKPMPSSD